MTNSKDTLSLKPERTDTQKVSETNTLRIQREKAREDKQ